MPRSIGMQERQLLQMMIGEGLILVVNNILITLIFGTAAGFVLVYAGKTVGADYLHWHFPAWYLFGYMVFVTAVPVAISGSKT